ncbi:hypothetical protein COO60DRAFT_1699022 [Scenedesmus sp. NREL 46B-D3]|nr:hypothetical protein COO60DRAFT_1699022 [Scenedesmus sp. NREL 46B-D3]
MASQAAGVVGDLGHAQLMQLCWGSGAEEMNLKKVQERVAELIRTIDTLLMEMHSRGIHWKSFLDQLSVINNTHTAIVAEVRPLMRRFIIYPKFVDNPGIENSLPELLASRLLPEQVEQDTAWRAALVPGGSIAPQAVNDFFTKVEQQTTELHNAVGWLTNVNHAISRDTPRELPAGVLDPKGKMRKDIDALTREISAAAAAAATAREKAGGSLPGQQHGVTSVIVGQKRPRPPGMPPGQPSAAAAAAAAAGPGDASAEDVLIAKIMSGELLREEGMGR